MAEMTLSEALQVAECVSPAPAQAHAALALLSDRLCSALLLLDAVRNATDGRAIRLADLPAHLDALRNGETCRLLAEVRDALGLPPSFALADLPQAVRKLRREAGHG
jgi:hypothetical protein